MFLYPNLPSLKELFKFPETDLSPLWICIRSLAISKGLVINVERELESVDKINDSKRPGNLGSLQTNAEQ